MEKLRPMEVLARMPAEMDISSSSRVAVFLEMGWGVSCIHVHISRPPFTFSRSAQQRRTVNFSTASRSSISDRLARIRGLPLYIAYRSLY